MCLAVVSRREGRLFLLFYIGSAIIINSTWFFVMHNGFGEGVMEQIRTFYNMVWLPFTSTKKRILILAIASYIALC